MAVPDFANNPLVKASGGKITPQQIEAYYRKTGSLPRWSEGPQGPIVRSSSFAKDIGWTNPGTTRSVVGTSASKAATAGQPGTGVGSLYIPNSMATALDTAGQKFNAPATAERGLLAEVAQRAGVVDLLSQAQNNPTAAAAPQAPVSQTPGITGPAQQTFTAPAAPLPGRTRANDITPATTNLGPVPTGGGGLPQSPVSSLAPGFGGVQQFFDWWNGQGPRMSGDLGSVYNMPAPVLTGDNEYLMPGMVGKTFGTGADDTLLAERVQAYQLTNGQSPYGPISPLIPPHLISQAGYGPESVLGGQYSLGQTIAADPSLQGMGNEGAVNWWQNQTPSGPYSGFQFPNIFGQNPNSTTHLPPGTGTNYNPYPGFGQPGTNQPPGGGGGQPGGGGTGTGGGGTGGGGTGTGGGGTGTGTGTQPSGQNPFPPISIDTGTPGGGIGTVGPDAFLADSANDVGYLRGIAENAGYATNQTPAWEAMVAAQQRNIDRNAALLGEKFNVSGNRFSSVFGDAMTDYYGQAGLDQNSLLAQMTLQAQEAARARELQAAGQLGSQGFQGASQLSNRGFQALMQQGQQAYGTAQNMFNASQNAAQQLLANSMAGAQGLFGAENQAGLAEAQRQQQLLQLMLGTAGNLDQTWIQNLLAGSALGEQQYTLGQNEIDRLYNEFLRTQPESNPLLPYMFSGATGYPPTAYPQFTPNYSGNLLGGLGGIMGMLVNAGVFNPRTNTHAGGGTNPTT